jgi:hypothetical protein
VRYLANCLEVLGAAFVGAVWGTYRPPTRLWDPERVEARARRLGGELVACAREQRDFPTGDEVIAQRRFLAELIWRNRKIFKADFEYWREHGWFTAPPGTPQFRQPISRSRPPWPERPSRPSRGGVPRPGRRVRRSRRRPDAGRR